MKFVKKVDESFNLKNLFAEHLTKFNLKNDQELTYLDDVKNFIEKKSQLELQYSQALSKLCNQYISKENYQLVNENSSQIFIPEKWKLILEQYAYIAEKKQVSSRSILMHCEYFKKIKDQKTIMNQMANTFLKKNHQILTESHHHSEIAYKTFCLDQFLCDQLDRKTALSMENLEKKLKARNLNVSKFKKNFEEMNKDEKISKDRLKKLDFSKLNYVTANCCQNQQLQYYFSMEVPQLLQLQNGFIDAFIDTSLNTLVLKEVESSKFLLKHFEDSILNAFHLNPENQNDKPNLQSNSSEGYFIDKNDCFSNLIQFDLQPHDIDFQPSFFSFQKENIKHLSDDYVKWSNKLNELESLMTAILTKVNEKKIDNTDKNSLNGTGSNLEVVFDQKQEEQRFLITEKKLQMIHLQAKIDALGSFNINLNDLDNYNNLNNFEEKREIFEANLHQNLELWDQLMKSIDDIQYSDESYDYDYIRKTSKDFTQSEESSESKISFSIFDPFFKENKKEIYSQIPNVKASYARTVDSFDSNDSNYLNFEKNQSLIIYDQVLDGVYRAKDYAGNVGLVNNQFIKFYKEEPVFVKSVYIYDGLDEQELSFPPDVFIRLLSKNGEKKKIDNEEWWEGVYNDKIGYFPSIFVQEIDKPKQYAKDESDFLSSPAIKNTSIEISTPFTENQKVPQ